jgi:hypothetical protein
MLPDEEQGTTVLVYSLLAGGYITLATVILISKL